ncbi:hypothetical protein BC830DRAFT_1174383 [Chytriomyces sp. MP71]|nr:hypothetical protein BC830DRAFT_1174383 [Chytriomyces sp. MP71]
MNNLPTPAEDHRIVAIAVDDLTTSESVVDWAAQNYLQPTDVALLINAHPGPSPLSHHNPSYAAQSNSLAHAAQRHSRATLAHLERRLRGTGTRAEVRVMALAGEAKCAIVDAAERVGASVLIVGSRDLGKMSRMVLGSVSQYCMRHCYCPVIVVKPPPDKVEAH